MAKEKPKKATKKKTKWACPTCGIDHTGKHKKTLKKPCSSPGTGCCGFVCECDGDTPKGHGDSIDSPCPYAVCHHCSWAGQFPPGEKIDWKDRYAREVARSSDYREHLEHILKFFEEAWDESPDQEDTEPCDRYGEFSPENTKVYERVMGHWCPMLIEDLKTALEPGVVYNPAKI